MKVDLINHHLKLVFVNSGLSFVQDKNNFIYPLLQIGSGEKKTDPDPTGQKSRNPTESGSSSLIEGKKDVIFTALFLIVSLKKKFYAFFL